MGRLSTVCSISGASGGPPALPQTPGRALLPPPFPYSFPYPSPYRTEPRALLPSLPTTPRSAPLLWHRPPPTSARLSAGRRGRGWDAEALPPAAACRPLGAEDGALPGWLLAGWGADDPEAGPFVVWDARRGRAVRSGVYVRMPPWHGRRVRVRRPPPLPLY